MSIFLDKEFISRKYDTKYPMDCLVHTYNKKYFNNREEAETMLMEKVLLPGEVAFGYYYDPLSASGTNAVFAVGPLSYQGGNILFKNATDVSSYTSTLDDYITNINEYITEVNTQLQSSMDDFTNIINESLDYINNEKQNMIDAITTVTNANINNTNVNVLDLSTKINNLQVQLDIIQEQLNNLING